MGWVFQEICEKGGLFSAWLLPEGTSLGYNVG